MIPKFRAYNPATNDWYKPEEVFVSDGNIYLDDDDFDDLTQNNDVTLMQSTGLFDKNGREIFAGDIIEQEGVFVVIRLDNTFGIYFELENGEFDFPEVSVLEELEEGREQASIYFNIVGNIYENKELLEGME